MKKKKPFTFLGQSVMEYALLLAIVASAIIAMQVYIKRGIQGRLRDLADQISSRQFEEGRTQSNYTINQSGTVVQQYVNGIATTYQDGTAGSTAETVVRSGNETVTPRTE